MLGIRHVDLNVSDLDRSVRFCALRCELVEIDRRVDEEAENELSTQAGA